MFTPGGPCQCFWTRGKCGDEFLFRLGHGDMVFVRDLVGRMMYYVRYDATTATAQTTTSAATATTNSTTTAEPPPGIGEKNDDRKEEIIERELV